MYIIGCKVLAWLCIAEFCLQDLGSWFLFSRPSFRILWLSVCGFKPLLVVMNHFLLEVKAGNKFPVVWVTSKHSCPLLLLAPLPTVA